MSTTQRRAPAPTGFASVGDAELFIMRLLGDLDLDAMTFPDIIRAARAAAAGDPASYARVALAEEYLIQNGYS